MKKEKILLSVFVLVLVIILTGCNGKGEIEGDRSKTSNKQEAAVNKQLCEQFDQNFVSQAIGQEIVSAIYEDLGTTYSCRYLFTDDALGPFVILVMNENLSVENQKKGAEFLDRRVSTDSRINMDHFIVTQNKDDNINAIYLVFGPNTFMRVERSSNKYLDNEGLINFAAKVAAKIK